MSDADAYADTPEEEGAQDQNKGGLRRAIKVRVYHSYYGCESGCCGHIIELDNGKSQFEFTHPYDEHDLNNLKNWARELAEGVIASRWPECLDSIDWDTLDVEGVDAEID